MLVCFALDLQEIRSTAGVIVTHPNFKLGAPNSRPVWPHGLSCLSCTPCCADSAVSCVGIYPLAQVRIDLLHILTIGLSEFLMLKDDVLVDVFLFPFIKRKLKYETFARAAYIIICKNINSCGYYIISRLQFETIHLCLDITVKPLAIFPMEGNQVTHQSRIAKIHVVRTCFNDVAYNNCV